MDDDSHDAAAAAIGAGKDRASFSAHSADGTLLAAEAKGDPAAPEILFIHGLRQSRLSWDRQFADPVLSGFRMVRFDLRGHGDSGKPTTTDAYADADRWADDVAAVVASARLRRPVIVGWSLGAHVAGMYLRKYGAGIAGFNLVCPVTNLSAGLLTPLAVDFARTATSHELAERVVATADFLAACFQQPPSDTDFQRMLVINGMTARAAHEGFNITSAPDLESVFAAYDGPILLTHGAHDRLVNVAMSERISALSPRSRLSIFAESGHSPFYEDATRFGRELAAFVTEANKD